jgi:hypothetical protein
MMAETLRFHRGLLADIPGVVCRRGTELLFLPADSAAVQVVTDIAALTGLSREVSLASIDALTQDFVRRVRRQGGGI